MEAVEDSLDEDKQKEKEVNETKDTSNDASDIPEQSSYFIASLLKKTNSERSRVSNENFDNYLSS